MAMYLRRVALSSPNPILLIRSCTGIIQSRYISHSLFSQNLFSNPQPREAPTLASHGSLYEFRRGFAKGGKKSKDDSGDSTAEAVNIGPAVKESARSQMDAAVVALSRELTKLRTGRASAGMLDHIIVETGGVKLPLTRLAVVSVLDPKTLSVNAYDPNTLKELEKAIVSSPLGLNPKVDGDRLIAIIPPLTKEHIQAMCKVVTKSCEDVKQSIRRARQKLGWKFYVLKNPEKWLECFIDSHNFLTIGSSVDLRFLALDSVKKARSSFPKDDAKRLEKEIDELTKKFVKSAEDMCKAKEKEISAG
ncbi:hypothetical protein Tsubulata_034082 [Turnera subulata]|uniref:Ribosome-recycling factor, chloroplastic n=1 Tax=Turnera subulata TaxID=218843 RepID=A0A9Q0JGE7_9ROSI|nr:hypothetical protein Tsubulata_034082 [Turnera subulata]